MNRVWLDLYCVRLMDGSYPDITGLTNQLMQFVYTIISFTVALVLIFVLVSFLPSLFKKLSPQKKPVITINKRVSSINIVGEYLTIKTSDNRLYAYSNPAQVVLEDYYPYKSLGNTLVGIGIFLLIIYIIYPMFKTYLPSLPIVELAISLWYLPIVVGIILLLIRKKALVIESHTGTATQFTKVDVNPATIEFIILELTRRKQLQRQKQQEEEKQAIQQQIQPETNIEYEEKPQEITQENKENIVETTEQERSQ